MDKIVPIGSVIMVEEIKALVVGSTLLNRDGKMIPYYLLVKFPRGYAGEESIGCVPVSEIKQIISEGFHNETGDKWCSGMLNIYGALEGKFEEEAQEMMSTVYKAIKEADNKTE